MSELVMAIDPGASGGIAWIVSNAVQAIRMPETYVDLFKALKRIREEAKLHGVPARAVVEHTSAMPGEGVVGVRHFGEHVGHLEMALYALGFSMRKVAPITWQNGLGVPALAKVGPRPEPGALEPGEAFKERKRSWAAARNRSKMAKKAAIKNLAQQRFPALAVTLSTADALMILDWALKQQPVGV